MVPHTVQLCVVSGVVLVMHTGVVSGSVCPFLPKIVSTLLTLKPQIHSRASGSFQRGKVLARVSVA